MKGLSPNKVHIFCLFLCIGIMINSCSNETDRSPSPYGAIPSFKQIEWQKLGYYMLISLPSKSYTNIDCSQWAATAKAAGFKGIVIVAKDNKGVCLWPSLYASKYLYVADNKASEIDLLKNLSQACKEYDLKFGLCLTLSDLTDPSYGTDVYNQNIIGMLTELLTNYGSVFELWLNYGDSDNSKVQLYNLDLFLHTINKIQPSTIICSDIGTDARSVDYDGKQRKDICRSTLNIKSYGLGVADAPPLDSLYQGNIKGDSWVPLQNLLHMRNKQTQNILLVKELESAFYNVIGGNSNLVVGIVPNEQGRIERSDSIRLMEARKRLEASFSDDLLEISDIEASNIRGNSDTFSPLTLKDANYNSYWTTDDSIHTATIYINFPKAKSLNRILLQEYIPLGQRINKLRIEYLKDKNWTPLVSTGTIGYKKIFTFPMVSTTNLRIIIDDSSASPILNRMSIYKAIESVSDPLITRDKLGYVSITCASNDPIIFYTTDGTEPTQQSCVYKEPLLLPGYVKIKAIAVADIGKLKSKVVTKEFDLSPVEWDLLSPRYQNFDVLFDDDKSSFIDIFKNQPIIIDFGKELILEGFTYTPSSSIYANNIYRYNLYISDDGKNWTKLLDNQSFPGVRTRSTKQFVRFQKAVKTRYLKLLNLETVKRGPKYTVADIGVITK